MQLPMYKKVHSKLLFSYPEPLNKSFIFIETQQKLNFPHHFITFSLFLRVIDVKGNLHPLFIVIEVYNVLENIFALPYGFFNHIAR